MHGPSQCAYERHSQWCQVTRVRQKTDVKKNPEILDVTFGEKPGGNGEKTKKNRYFTEIEPYLY